MREDSKLCKCNNIYVLCCFLVRPVELLSVLQQNVVKCQRLVLAFDVCYPAEIADMQKFDVRFYSGCSTSHILCAAGHMPASGSQLLAFSWRESGFPGSHPFLGVQPACHVWWMKEYKGLVNAVALWRVVPLQSSLWGRLRPCCGVLHCSLICLWAPLSFPSPTGWSWEQCPTNFLHTTSLPVCFLGNPICRTSLLAFEDFCAHRC